MVRQRTRRGERPKRGSTRRLRFLVSALLGCAAYDSDAVNQVVLEVGQISTASVQGQNATITLDVTPRPDSSSPTLRAKVGQLHLAAPHTTYSDVDISCTNLLIKQPQFACNEGTLAARGGPPGANASSPKIAMNVTAAFDSSSGAISSSGSGLEVAGATTRFTGKLESGAWALNVDGDGLDLESVRKWAQPLFQLPRGDTLTGHWKFRVESTGRLDSARGLGKLQARLSASTADLNYSNQPGTVVGQNLTVAITGTAAVDRGAVASNMEVRSYGGQALAGTVLLDFARNPLNLTAHLQSGDHTLSIAGIRLDQTDLIEADGSARLAWGASAPSNQRGTPAPVTIEQAHFDIHNLEFAAAYRSFLQLTLATTDFGALNAGGRATGEIDIANNAVSRIKAVVQNVSMADSTARLSLANANGELHWSAAAAAAPEPSHLSWSSSSAYGLIGGPVQMRFTAHGKNFVLEGDTRFPIFDGALIVHTLAIRRVGAPSAELDFDAHLEPISMPILSKAFGWPILSGQLAGRIPGVTYRNSVLSVEGDLSASVFDGTIVGSRIELRDPLGPWPRLDADVTARHLDLDLLTHTFSIGSISGRLDADILGLELFNWSPVAFDARLQTTPGDTSEHLISQKAVTSISSVGGGGGGVAAALQSGVLKFFDKFHYDRIGISCQLRDEVCLMSGLEPARTGYYLVKGRGLPRIDIIGNAGRVDWTQLVGQIAASMHSQNIVVR